MLENYVDLPWVDSETFYFPKSDSDLNRIKDWVRRSNVVDRNCPT